MSLSPNRKRLLAVIDSGVGGLSVVAELRLILPNNAVIYYADSANCPYGAKSNEEIVALTEKVVAKVVDMGAEVVVVACNTMTAAAIKTLRNKWREVDFIGMEPALKPALQSSKSGVVGVLATKATLRGELYNITKSKYSEGKTVIEVAGSGLVECVEEERCESKECRELLEGYLLPMVERGADRIVLGCTHYPFLTDGIAEILERVGRGDVEIINPAPAIAKRARMIAERRGMVPTEGEGSIEYLTSGTEENKKVLEKFLDNHGTARNK